MGKVLYRKTNAKCKQTNGIIFPKTPWSHSNGKVNVVWSKGDEG